MLTESTSISTQMASNLTEEIVVSIAYIDMMRVSKSRQIRIRQRIRHAWRCETQFKTEQQNQRNEMNEYGTGVRNYGNLEG